MTGGDLLVLAPLRVEAAAVRGVLPGARVVRCGMGPRRARAAAAGAAAGPARAVAVVGLCAGVADGLRPGDLVVASEVRDPAGTVVRCPSADVLAAALASRGLRVRVGPVHSTERLLSGAVARAAAAAAGAVAVDMESAWLAPAAAGRPFAVVRAVSDTAAAPLLRPGVVGAGLTALRSLRAAASALSAWAVWAAEPARDPAVRVAPTHDSIMEVS